MVQRGLSISLAPVTCDRPISPPADETRLAFRYLILFRRVVVSLAAVGAALAWAYQIPALTAALVCVGIGEWLESSYYITVLRWRQRHAAVRRDRDGAPLGRRAHLAP